MRFQRSPRAINHLKGNRVVIIISYHCILPWSEHQTQLRRSSGETWYQICKREVGLWSHKKLRFNDPTHPKVIPPGKCAKQRIVQKIKLHRTRSSALLTVDQWHNSLLVYKSILGPVPQKIPVAAGAPVAELHVKEQKKFVAVSKHF